MKKIVSFFKNLSDNTKIVLCRLWFSGMVCFFVAMGTGIGQKESTFELIFALGVIMGVANLFIFNPVVYGMFELERRGKIANKKFTERSILEGAIYMITEVLKSFFAVYIVSWFYAGINIVINLIRDVNLDTISFPLEAFGFAIIFTFIYVLMGYIWDLVVILFNKIKFKERKAYDEKNMG